MKSRYRVELLVVAAGAILLAPVVSRAAHPPSGSALYQFTTIDGPGSSFTLANGINNPGLVSGYYVINGIAHAFLWQNGKVTTVDNPGAAYSLLGGVSNSGLAAGNYGPFETQHAAIYSIHSGSWITLPDVPGFPSNFGNGINPQGIVVGFAYQGTLAQGNNAVGWIWDGKYSFFTAPGSDPATFGTGPIGINSQGDVSGNFSDSSGVFHGFLKQGSKFTQIDVPGATYTVANGLNNRGDIVGYYADQQNINHGFLLSGGQFTTIDVPGSIGTLIFDINEPGDLVGYFQDSTSRFHGFSASRH
jgi:probable HAF family extracellular repeat protein